MPLDMFRAFELVAADEIDRANRAARRSNRGR
jgi:hypothetical protein